MLGRYVKVVPAARPSPEIQLPTDAFSGAKPFAQVIDLDALDCISVQPGTEDLKVKLKVQEEQNAAELTAWNRKIHSATDELSRKSVATVYGAIE